MFSPSTNHVLVTGATGFVATHIVDQLLIAGYTITATTRDAAKIQQYLKTFPHWAGKVTFTIVPDFTLRNAFDEVFKSNRFDYVLHTASPIPSTISGLNIKDEMIDPGPRGVQSLMNAASEYGGATLKRVILTGSVVSCVDPFLGPANGRDKPWDEEDWNPITYDAAIASNHAGLAYFATKTLAEQAAWAFMATHKPRFDLTVLLPSITLGPVLTPVIAANQIEQGADKHVYAFFNGVHKDADCPFIFYSHVDVRDVARAHILSMTLPAAGGQRIALTTSELLSPQRVVNIINGRFPQLRDRVARGDLYQLYPSGSKPTLANGTKAERIFGDGWRYRTVEETVTDVVTQILEQEKSWGPCVQ